MPTLKLIHVSCVALSISFFFLRGIWMLRDSPLLNSRWGREAPHYIDTVLLLSALAWAWQIQQYPFVHAWLTTKVFGLLAYIVLGSIALKRGKTKAVRIGAWLAALLVYGYIVSVARAHHPLGLFA